MSQGVHNETGFQVNIFDTPTLHTHGNLESASVRIGDVIRLFHAEHDAFLEAAGSQVGRKICVHHVDGTGASRNSNRLFVVTNPDHEQCGSRILN